MAEYFFIYRSSAGSGKTYTLVREYLLLALKNPENNYRHILAITFTNKAMQEMKNRIIASLSHFTQGSPHPMKDELINKLDVGEDEFINRSKVLLQKILHEYSYFSISTIDAFFQRIIRSFTKELGLYGQYQLETDQDLVKINAIDNLLADLKENDHLTSWIVKFSEEQLDAGKNWDIRRSLNDFAGEIFKEHFTDLESRLPAVANIKEFQEILSKEVAIFKAQLESLSKNVVGLLESSGIEIGELKYNTRGTMAFVLNVLNGSIQEPGVRSKNGCANPDEWVKKTEPRAEYILEIAESKLCPALSEAVDYYYNNQTKYYSALAALKFIYGFGLLSDLTHKIQSYKHERDILFIQDASRLIKALMKDSDTPFIFEKVGTFFSHYLIDEFQDTSSMQWQCLHPLVLDTISQGNMSMVVGDTKQSIYRWRGGDWSLLEHQIMQDILPQPHKLEQLNSNFRSAGNIINFNNLLFTHIPLTLLGEIDLPEDDLEDDTTLLINKIAGVYNNCAQTIPAGKENKGLVEIKFLETDGDDNWQNQVLTEVVQKIEDVLSRGYKYNDIALLVRKKDEAAMLAQYLLDFSDEEGNPRFPVLTNEALLIKNSRVVMIIINALQYIHSPQDEIALAELVYHYHCLNNPGVPLKFHKIQENEVDDKLLPFDLAREKAFLQHLSIEEAVEYLIRLFSLPGNSGEAAYLQTFQDKVLEFGRAESNDINSFLLWWEEKGEKESINIPSGLDAITIMTIHKAKGLQFPVVITPFASWEVDSKSNTLLWSSSSEPPYSGLDIPLRYASELKYTYFRDDYYKEKFQAALDSVNMLYVAFTRAEQELYVYAPGSGRATIGTSIFKSLSDPDFSLYSNFAPQDNSFRLGSETAPVKGEEVFFNQVMIEKYESHNWRDRLVIREVKNNKSVSMEEALRGTFMHGLLSKIEYATDLKEKFFFSSMNDEELKNELQKIISHHEVADYFSKPYLVMNEKNILRGNDIYRPDRIVLHDNSAVVIDYKWGEMQGRYAEQVRQYLYLMKELGYKESKGLIYYVDKKIVEKVAWRIQ